MKIVNKIAIFFLICTLVLSIAGCGEPKYKTTKTITHVPTTTTETRVVGQRIVDERIVYLPDGSIIDSSELEGVTDIEDIIGDTDTDDTDDSSDSSDDSSSDTSINVPPMTDNFIENGTFNYQIIRANDSSEAVTVTTKNFIAKLKEKLNCKVTYKTDSVSKHPNIREFLVGKTNRASSIIAENKLRQKNKNCFYDAIICTVGNDICLFAYEKTALNAAFDYFINNYCNGSYNKVPTNIEWYFSGNANVIDVSIASNHISQYKIVIPKSPSELILGSAFYLQEYIETYAGVPIDIIHDTTESSGYEINLGSTSRNIAPPSDKEKAYAKIQDNKLCYSSSNDEMIYMLVKDFAEGIKISSSYAIPSNYNREVSYNELRSSFGNGYNLVWYDEFNSDSINWDIWEKYGQQDYSDTGATVIIDSNKYNVVRNGFAEIPMTRIKSKRYTTGYFGSSTLFTYGYMEMRMKTAPGNTYVAWWLNSISGGGYARPEIDMFETFNSPKSLKANLHTWEDKENGEGTSGHIDHASDADKGENVFNREFKARGESGLLADEWHIFGVEWTPDMITLYIDGEIYCKWDISEETWGTRYKAFRDIPCKMIITSRCCDDNSLPIGETATSYVDYVRVYQRNDSQTGYDSYISKSMTVS